MASRATQFCLPQYHLTNKKKLYSKYLYSPFKYSESICPSAMAFGSKAFSLHYNSSKYFKILLHLAKNSPSVAMATSKQQLEVHKEDQTPSKWSVSLGEEVFRRFLGQANQTVQKVFGDGSFFSPLLFGKFFDPADAFPLWEFESDILLSNLRMFGKSATDWFQTDQEYVLQAEIPEAWRNTMQIFIEDGKVLEISGQLKQQQQREGKTIVDWRRVNWWEHGYVRRLELPDDADWLRMDARVKNETIVEIKIPKSETNQQGVESKSKDSDEDE